MSTPSIVVVSAGLGVPSSSRMLADQLAESAVEALGAAGATAEVETIELRELALDIANHLVTGFAPPALAAVQERLAAADALIVVSPVFSGSYSGLLKSFFDVLDPKALEGMPVLLGATGGSARHSLMLEHALRPLFSYLRAVVVPTAVYAAPQDWGAGSGDGAPGLEQRSRRAAKELVALILGSVGPRPARAPEVSAPFEELLAKIQGNR
ncbi:MULTISPECIES: FMN reductase [Arthrobacter]|uniref:NADPH-dependent FMN reductase n=1 Tax=Arthrobacter crusticola TaxID=2547960 RepID=A0A4R5TYX5_9MICC|nr:MULTISPECIES: FMN reductase [Arthrobacter]TDK26459.1 NADPH-dependent FMN reductase [Arthrobacter crusticola]